MWGPGWPPDSTGDSAGSTATSALAGASGGVAAQFAGDVFENAAGEKKGLSSWKQYVMSGTVGGLFGYAEGVKTEQASQFSVKTENGVNAEAKATNREYIPEDVTESVAAKRAQPANSVERPASGAAPSIVDSQTRHINVNVTQDEAAADEALAGNQRGQSSAEEHTSSTSEQTASQERGPNPWGKKGSPRHQAYVQDEVRTMRAKFATNPDIEVRTEARVVGKDGKVRYLDVQAVNRRTGEIVDQVQVGRTIKSGAPVIRERRAMEDIDRTTGANTRFRPYDK